MLEILEAVDGPIRGQAPFTEEGNGPLNHKLEAICKKTADAIREQPGEGAASPTSLAKK